MSISDKAEELGGKLKATAGEATGDKELQAEGHADQAVAKAKQTAEEVADKTKDFLEGAADKVKDAVESVKDKLSGK